MKNNYWLMTSDALTILRRLGRRLQAEFDICLRFSDDNLEQKLGRAKAKSADTETRQLIGKLEEIRGMPFLTGGQALPRLYRGHPKLNEPRQKDIYELIYGEDPARHDPFRQHRLSPIKM
ncbi:hypothetical protein [Microbulbifer rhizosphaerae]|uniref:Uncharacterized protein n=1 Tax=Microbulbifer rhizosphaerae TaxID=1562603 RepID=A0A7W4Z917_9GAMM|nr:hypothetical protein [Microbulbifer rhizosphaerae]MBB3059755.1 hypothetical protein [Microbulbifer rhizosphaerae]